MLMRPQWMNLYSHTLALPICLQILLPEVYWHWDLWTDQAVVNFSFFSNTIMYLNVYNGITVGKIGKKSKRNKVLKSELGGLLQVSSVGEIDLKPNINVSMKLREGIYAFYDNYAISGFILTVSDNIYTDRSKIIAGEKSSSLSIEFGSNGVTFQSNLGRKLHYRLLAYYK